MEKEIVELYIYPHICKHMESAAVVVMMCDDPSEVTAQAKADLSLTK